MKDVITNKQGHCPYCDSDDVWEDDYSHEYGQVVLYMVCTVCKESYTETFTYKESVGDRQIEE